MYILFSHKIEPLLDIKYFCQEGKFSMRNMILYVFKMIKYVVRIFILFLLHIYFCAIIAGISAWIWSSLSLGFDDLIFDHVRSTVVFICALFLVGTPILPLFLKQLRKFWGCLYYVSLAGGIFIFTFFWGSSVRL